MNENPFLHEWHNQTTLHPLGLAAVIVLGLLMVLLPRRHAVLPMIVMAAFIAPAQRIVLLTLDFNLLRIMVIWGCLRVLLRGEFHGFHWKRIDTVVVLWVLVCSTAYILLRLDKGAVVNRLGWSYDALGMYFLFRFLVRDLVDVRRIAGHFVLISIPVMFAFLVEKSTGRNLFAVFGGVPEMTMVRQGRLRCQGAFAHPILAGTFWAAAMPLIAALWWGGGRGKPLAILGSVTSLTIVILSASSTPVAAALCGLAGGFMVLARDRMRMVRWAALAGIVLVHFVREKPAWHLLARIDIAGGSTGYHRYRLIDAAIERFGEWALLGTRSTAHWGWGLFDVTNEYVNQAVMGGFLTLVLFVSVLWLAFRGIGQNWRLVAADPARLALTWAVGVALFVHVTSFIAVSYFGQIITLFYLTLAMAGSLTPGETEVSPAAQEAGASIPGGPRRKRLPERKRLADSSGRERHRKGVPRGRRDLVRQGGSSGRKLLR